MSMSTHAGLRVAVTGATGNVGTSVVRALSTDPEVADVLGLARRRPEASAPGVRWAAVDLSHEDSPAMLDRYLADTDAVVHLAWRFQPTHDPVVTWRNNVLGSVRVFEAVARAGVPTLVHASSVGAYSPGPKAAPGVDEEWPTHGWPDAAYCREKSYLERVLDSFELRHPEVRLVRMRPGFLFKEQAASDQRRIFAGRYVPGALLRPDLLPFVPDLPGLRLQVLHTDGRRRHIGRPCSQRCGARSIWRRSRSSARASSRICSTPEWYTSRRHWSGRFCRRHGAPTPCRPPRISSTRCCACRSSTAPGHTTCWRGNRTGRRRRRCRRFCAAYVAARAWTPRHWSAGSGGDHHDAVNPREVLSPAGVRGYRPPDLRGRARNRAG